MRDVKLIRERMEPILTGSAQEIITEADLVEDWRLSLQEMALCGFDTSALVLQLDIYNAVRRRGIPEKKK